MTLQQQRLISIRLWGERDSRDGMPLIVPVFLSNAREQAAYVFGHRQESRRLEREESQS